MGEFEKAVRKALIDKDITLNQLAKDLDISLAYIYEIFKSEQKGEKHKSKILNYLNLNINEN